MAVLTLAAILLAKWPNFEQEVEARSRIGATYTRKLQSAELPPPPAGASQHKRVCPIHRQVATGGGSDHPQVSGHTNSRALPPVAL